MRATRKTKKDRGREARARVKGIRAGGVRLALGVVLAVASMAAAPAFAGVSPSANPLDAVEAVNDVLDASCPAALHPARLEAEVAGLIAAVESAATVDEARQIATADSRLAYDVLARAQRVAPWSDGLAIASARLDRFHAGIDAAGTRTAIADSVRGFMSTPQVAACDYTGGEVIAIVLGFVLGIIPGLILLVLLC